MPGFREASFRPSGFEAILLVSRQRLVSSAPGSQPSRLHTSLIQHLWIGVRGTAISGSHHASSPRCGYSFSSQRSRVGPWRRLMKWFVDLTQPLCFPFLTEATVRSQVGCQKIPKVSMRRYECCSRAQACKTQH